MLLCTHTTKVYGAQYDQMYFAIWGVHLAYDGVIQTSADQLLSRSQQTVAAVYEHFFNGVNYSFVSDSLLPDSACPYKIS